jgi:hypothetical protein
MKKRFIILLDNPSKEQDAAFLRFVRDTEHFGYWHWFNGSWLLYSSKPHHSSEFIRDKLCELFPGLHSMVFEFSEDQKERWHGFGPSNDKHNMYRWLHENWH